jgi:hypothetical protein
VWARPETDPVPNKPFIKFPQIGLGPIPSLVEDAAHNYIDQCIRIGSFKLVRMRSQKLVDCLNE